MSDQTSPRTPHSGRQPDGSAGTGELDTVERGERMAWQRAHKDFWPYLGAGWLT